MTLGRSGGGGVPWGGVRGALGKGRQGGGATSQGEQEDFQLCCHQIHNRGKVGKHDLSTDCNLLGITSI